MNIRVYDTVTSLNFRTIIKGVFRNKLLSLFALFLRSVMHGNKYKYNPKAEVSEI